METINPAYLDERLPRVGLTVFGVNVGSGGEGDVHRKKLRPAIFVDVA